MEETTLPPEERERRLTTLERLIAELEATGLADAAQALRQQASAIRQHHDLDVVAPTSALAAAPGAQSVALIGHDNIIITGAGNYIGPPPRDEAEALQIYRRVIAQSCGYLPLRGIGIGESDPASAQPLRLANVYVSMDTRTQVEIGTGQRGDSLAEQKTRSLSALEAVAGNRRTVLLGDPGGGKSAFLNHLAYCLNTGEATLLEGWPVAEAEAVPALLLLRDFARSLPEDGGNRDPYLIWDYLCARLNARCLDFAVDPLRRALEHGQAVVLLDGLDEVYEQNRRILVRDIVAAFVERYPQNRYLVTCRTLAYQDPLGRLPGFVIPIVY